MRPVAQGHTACGGGGRPKPGCPTRAQTTGTSGRGPAPTLPFPSFSDLGAPDGRLASERWGTARGGKG